MKQDKNERVEVYYERLLKLTNNLQHKTIDNSIITIFRSRLQTYTHVAIVGMKKKPCNNIRKQLWFVKKEFVK
jgi:hypothetical protein